jgi:hypothetical protein
VLAETLPGVLAGARKPRTGRVDEGLGARRLLPPLAVLLGQSAPSGRAGGPVAVPAVAVAAHGPGVRVDLEDRRGEIPQERAVVGDDDDRPPVGREPPAQPCDGVGVEVVRRLVQEEEFGARAQRAGEGQPGALAAGQRSQGPRTVDPADPEPVEGGGDARVRLVPTPFGEDLQQLAVPGEFVGRRTGEVLLGTAQRALQGPQAGEVRVDGVAHGRRGRQAGGLGQVREAAGGAQRDLPLVGSLEADEEAEQGGLAGSVLPDDRDPLSGADGERDPVEDTAGPEVLGEVTDRELGPVRAGRSQGVRRTDRAGRRGGGRGGRAVLGAVAHGSSLIVAPPTP